MKNIRLAIERLVSAHRGGLAPCRAELQEALGLCSNSQWRTAERALWLLYGKRFQNLHIIEQIVLIRDLLDLCREEKLSIKKGAQEFNRRIDGKLEAYLAALMARPGRLQ